MDSPTAGRLLGTKSFIENRLHDAEGNHVGTLEEIIIDVRTGCVRHVVIAVGGIFGIGAKRVAVPWSALTPDPEYRRCAIDTAHMQFTAVRVPKDDPWLQRTDSASRGAAFRSQMRAVRSGD